MNPQEALHLSHVFPALFMQTAALCQCVQTHTQKQIACLEVGLGLFAHSLGAIEHGILRSLQPLFVVVAVEVRIIWQIHQLA